MIFNIYYFKGFLKKNGIKEFVKLIILLINFYFLVLLKKRTLFVDSKLNKIHFIIFSKNRASQLDLLLRSIKKMIKGNFSISVIFKYSNDNFLRGYEKLKILHENVDFLSEKEGKLKFQILNLVENSDSKYISLLVDDIVFINKFEIIQILKPLKNLDTFSLRLGENIKWSYSNNKIQNQPKFDLKNMRNHNFLFWNAKKK